MLNVELRVQFSTEIKKLKDECQKLKLIAFDFSKLFIGFMRGKSQ